MADAHEPRRLYSDKEISSILKRATENAQEVMRGLVKAGVMRASADEIQATATNILVIATFWLNYSAVRGERDIAVGNVVGSNLFNIMGVLGLSGIVSSQGITVSETALYFDIPVMIAVAIACDLDVIGRAGEEGDVPDIDRADRGAHRPAGLHPEEQ